jgi:hypothetical protein
MQHGCHINISLQNIFSSNGPCGKIYARNAVSGPLFTVVNAGKTVVPGNGGCGNK